MKLENLGTARPDEKAARCAGVHRNALRVVECGVKLAKRRFSARRSQENSPTGGLHRGVTFATV